MRSILRSLGGCIEEAVEFRLLRPVHGIDCSFRRPLTHGGEDALHEREIFLWIPSRKAKVAWNATGDLRYRELILGKRVHFHLRGNGSQSLKRASGTALAGKRFSGPIVELRHQSA